MSMPPKNSLIINVCVIPTDEVGAQCVGISQSLKSEATMFTLDGKSKFAHMTVFMARFAENKISEILEVTQKALQGVSSFRCEHVGYFMTEGRYLEISYRKSDDFMELHEVLIKYLALLRINPGNPFEEGYFTPYTPDQQNNAKMTGYDLAYGLYRPHITLTRYFDNKLPALFPAFPGASLSFMLGKVCIYKADDNGAIYEKLAEFEIKK